MSTEDITEIESAIAALPPDSQLRVNTVAEMLRDMISHDSEVDETWCAMLLVMEELNTEDETIEMDLAAGETRQ
jgi:hypothetical protein